MQNFIFAKKVIFFENFDYRATLNAEVIPYKKIL